MSTAKSRNNNITRLVIVESPTKAKTISRFLPSEDYRIEASMGHVRDLPASASEIPKEYKGEKWARTGISLDTFDPLYVIPQSKKTVVNKLKSALKEADELYIATDEDREGESIGWHLVQVLNPKIPVKRMVFHEITKEAILGALEKTRQIDQHLVDAQETRRVLDRLVGYTVSPVLWKKVAPKLSAGRVQSVAVRLLVAREIERIHFVPASYWDLKAHVNKESRPFESAMTHLAGIRLASGRDFNENTGKLKDGLTAGRDVYLMSEPQAKALAGKYAAQPWTVKSVEERTEKRHPAPPFTTSTLQQESSRKLNLSSKQTMQFAQRLYEQGYITYMRTDSTTLSQEAIDASRQAVRTRYGQEFLSPEPRQYTTKARNAQEAHEAIRPAGTQMKTRDELGLSGPEGALYDLIWKRTVAAQMAEARLRLMTVAIEVGSGDELATFRASGRTTEFAGFLRAYVEGSDDPEAALEEREQPLPPLKEGDRLNANAVEAAGHQTKPPARFTEATLIKFLEKESIGRPSTYASIIDTVIQRGYVRKLNGQLIPTFTAFAVDQLLGAFIRMIVDVGFTSSMEETLDDIAGGRLPAKPYLAEFYRGLEEKVGEADKGADPREISTLNFSQWSPYVVRVGRYGPYVEGEHNGEAAKKSLPDDLAPGDVTREVLKKLIEEGIGGEQPIAVHPETGQPIFVKRGPYGAYVQLGENDQDGEKPKRVSLPKGLEPAGVTPDIAVELLRLPRNLGEHPETGKKIEANIGRFGPYVKHGSTFASLTKDDDVLTVGLGRALELIRKKENKNAPLKVLGMYPGTEDEVDVREGRYGPYVKYGKVNVSLPKDITVESVTLEDALKLLESKVVAAPAKKSASKKAPAKKGVKAKGTAKATKAKKAKA